VPSFWTLGERLLLIQQCSLSLPTARVLIFGRDKDADIARSMEQLFSGESGSLFLTVLHEIFWKTLFLGDRTPGNCFIAPDDCWALRRGRLQNVDATDEVLRCSHLDRNAGSEAYRAVEQHARKRLLQCLCAKHKLVWSAAQRFPETSLHEVLGLVCLTKRTSNLPWATT